MSDKNNIIFKPRARLLLQLGDQLIKNESIALLELVKNSYDADATKVNISMENIDTPDKGIIFLEDNGVGMDMDIIKNVWMEPASDYKEKLLEEKKVTKEFKRLPLGEKGIGRFSVYKLGEEIELITKKGKNSEILIKINWNDFQNSKYLDEMSIKIIEREPVVFTGSKTGTKIIIKKLKTPWTKQMVKEVYRSVNSMCSPFDAPDSFVISFHTDKKEWIEGLLSWDEVKDYALFSVDCEIEGQYINKFNYKFTPWPAMKKLHPRQITEKNDEVKKVAKMADKDNVAIDLSAAKIGKIKFKALIFDRDTKVLSLGVQDKRGLKDYLDINGGIRIYRDGVRVYDYGEPGNDWLDLGTRRINIPTKRISNNIVLGAIHLAREDSTDLEEKTNREGFVDNEAFNVFKAAVLYVLEKIETFREIDKDRIRTFYGPTPASEPVISDLADLKKVVDTKIKDKKLKDDISVYLKRIEADYKYINETLLKSAGAGLNLGVVIHEAEKIIEELVRVIAKEKPSARIVALVKHLAQLVEGYSVIIRNTGRKTENIKKLIEQAVFNIEFRLDAHKIEVVQDYSAFKGGTTLHCARNLVIGTILNILDNSIWWLDYGDVKDKKIYITVTDKIPDFLSVVIADNGPGFSLPTEEIVKPFVSAKPDGMGLGLHIAKSVMEAHGGELLFQDEGDVAIPKEFKSGAVVILAFRKEQKK
jgi:signal transduction histidine kinase